MLGRISGRAVGFGLPLVAVAIMAAACGGGGTTAGSGNGNAPAPASASQGGGPSSSGGAPAVKSESGPAGTFLADQNGRTLYIFTQDKGTTSSCYGACATAWPPMLANGSVGVSGSATMSNLGTTKRTDGTTQVTYAGHPLYYFQSDSNPGMTKGQGFQGVWFMLSPSGTVIRSTTPPATTGGSGGGGGGGGGWA